MKRNPKSLLRSVARRLIQNGCEHADSRRKTSPVEFRYFSVRGIEIIRAEYVGDRVRITRNPYYGKPLRVSVVTTDSNFEEKIETIFSDPPDVSSQAHTVLVVGDQIRLQFGMSISIEEFNDLMTHAQSLLINSRKV